MGVLSAIGAGLNAIAYGAKAIAAYLGLIHDAKEQQAGVNQQLAADQAAIIKGDADGRKIEAQVELDSDPAQLDRLRAQREAVARRQ